MTDYSKLLIKDYKYWSVQIHTNQSYLGRCTIWCKRIDALDLTQATPEEHEDLFIIMNQLKDALTKCFQPDWFNYAFLGNCERHLHCHFIPRYAGPREFSGIKFEDKRWGHNYKTDHDFIITQKVLFDIQNKIMANL